MAKKNEFKDTRQGIDLGDKDKLLYDGNSNFNHASIPNFNFSNSTNGSTPHGITTEGYSNAPWIETYYANTFVSSGTPIYSYAIRGTTPTFHETIFDSDDHGGAGTYSLTRTSSGIIIKKDGTTVTTFGTSTFDGVVPKWVIAVLQGAGGGGGGDRNAVWAVKGDSGSGGGGGGCVGCVFNTAAGTWTMKVGSGGSGGWYSYKTIPLCTAGVNTGSTIQADTYHSSSGGGDTSLSIGSTTYASAYGGGGGGSSGGSGGGGTVKVTSGYCYVLNLFDGSGTSGTFTTSAILTGARGGNCNGHNGSSTGTYTLATTGGSKKSGANNTWTIGGFSGGDNGYSDWPGGGGASYFGKGGSGGQNAGSSGNTGGTGGGGGGGVSTLASAPSGGKGGKGRLILWY